MLTGALANAAQALAESLMLDSCTIDRASDDPTDPQGTRVTVYSGKCRVRAANRMTTEFMGPVGAPADFNRFRVDIPTGTTGIEFRDHVVIDASVDPANVGTEGYVITTPTQSLSSAQRIWCDLRLR